MSRQAALFITGREASQQKSKSCAGRAADMVGSENGKRATRFRDASPFFIGISRLPLNRGEQEANEYSRGGDGGEQLDQREPGVAAIEFGDDVFHFMTPIFINAVFPSFGANKEY
jgi:hypothetical protein